MYNMGFQILILQIIQQIRKTKSQREQNWESAYYSMGGIPEGEFLFGLMMVSSSSFVDDHPVHQAGKRHTNPKLYKNDDSEASKYVPLWKYSLLVVVKAMNVKRLQ